MRAPGGTYGAEGAPPARSSSLVWGHLPFLISVPSCPMPCRMCANLSAMSRRDAVLQTGPGFCQYPPSFGRIIMGKVVREEEEESFLSTRR